MLLCECVHGLQDWPNYQCQLGVARLSMRSAGSRYKFFMMADNNVGN